MPVVSTGSAHGLQVDLTPLGVARLLLGPAFGELASRAWRRPGTCWAQAPTG